MNLLDEALGVLCSDSSIRRWLRELGIVAAHLLDEALGVLGADERLELDTEREVGRRRRRRRRSRASCCW
jgi:hypothetical protein